MRKQPYLSFVFARVLQVCVLLMACLFLTACGSNEPEAAKLRVKVVDIRGTKVRLPIPDGFEEMQRDDSPKLYDWMIRVTEGVGRIPLGFFIKKEDKLNLKINKNTNPRYGMAFVDSDFWDAVISEDSMRDINEHFLRYTVGLAEGVNSLRREKGKIEFDFEIIHEGKNLIINTYCKKMYKRKII